MHAKQFNPAAKFEAGFVVVRITSQQAAWSRSVRHVDCSHLCPGKQAGKRITYAVAGGDVFVPPTVEAIASAILCSTALRTALSSYVNNVRNQKPKCLEPLSV
jgi:hypothetical protein